MSRIPKRWRLTGLGVALLVVLIGVVTAVGLSSSGNAPLSDATPCSEWASAGSAQRTAYARLYLTEHDALLGLSGEATRVQAAIDSNCAHAAYLGEADEVTVLAAIERHF